jgi:MarR family transcriptional regulator for hemolysin
MADDAFREISLLMTHMRRVSSVSVNKRLSAVGMSLPAYKVLFRLVHDREVLQHDLAWDAAMDPAAVSRLIRGMLDDGLVETRVDPADKRQRFVRLTARGRELERSLSPIVDAAFAPYSQVLTPAEQKTLVTILRKAAEGVARVAQEAQTAEQADARDASQPVTNGRPARRTLAPKVSVPRTTAAKRAPRTSRP